MRRREERRTSVHAYIEVCGKQNGGGGKDKGGYLLKSTLSIYRALKI